MTLPTNDDFAKSELSTGKLETISGGLFLADGGHGGGHGITTGISRTSRWTLPHCYAYQ